MYDTMQIHDIVSIKLKFTSNARYLKMDYKLKVYFQRAAIKTVAITSVPHHIVGTIHFIPSVGTGRPSPPGEGSAKWGNPPREGPPTVGSGMGAGEGAERERPGRDLRHIAWRFQ